MKKLKEEQKSQLQTKIQENQQNRLSKSRKEKKHLDITPSTDINNAHNLVEYLYVDHHRLDSYFEQISQPVAYDKVPTWKADVSLKGPKAGTTQTRFAREFTTHEKITALMEYLEKSQFLGEYRPSGRSALKCGVAKSPVIRGKSCHTALWGVSEKSQVNTGF